ncbi:MAG: BtpA/SgcQ family protein [Bacteroidetes bacterium]|nr:BtpA/SgcQ family protein [Bacteroidota bacterium]
MKLFDNHKPVIGCIHLLALPGAPKYEGSMEKILDAALMETEIYTQYHLDGLIVENFRDVPFYPTKLPPETIAAMAVIAKKITEIFNGPVGINALRNDASSALAVAVASGAHFIRVNVHTGAALTDQGTVEGKAFETLRLKKSLQADIKIFADVHVKHAAALGNRSIEQEATDAVERGLADALIVSGSGTGAATPIKDLERVKQSVQAPVFIGSGTHPGNLQELYNLADGFIVGSFFKKDGKANNLLDETRVKEFMDFYHSIQ